MAMGLSGGFVTVTSPRRHMEWMLVTGMVKGHAFVFTRRTLRNGENKIQE